MSGLSEISPVYLASRRDTAGFLDRRRTFTRTLGANSADEDRFITADYNPDRNLSAFRGIGYLNPSPFATRSLKDFRGLMKNDFPGFTNPDTYIGNDAFADRYPEKPEPLNFRPDDFRQAENIDYGEVEDWVYVEQHPQVGDLLAVDEHLQEKFLESQLDSDSHLQSEMAEFARQKLERYAPLDDLYLTDNPSEARLIGLNIGGSADILNDDAELATSLTEEPRSSYSQSIRRELAEKVAGEFKSETGLDEAFFRENPEAAVYFQRHPGQIDRFNQRPEDAEDFKRSYGAIKPHIEAEAREYAETALSDGGGFIEDYLAREPDFAYDVAADRLLKQGDSLTDTTIRYDSLPDKYRFTNEVYDRHLASLAGEKLGEGHQFNREYFLGHPQLAFTVQSSPELAEGLKSASPQVSRFFGTEGKDAHIRTYIRGAMLSFSAGYPLRDKGMVDLWA